MAYAFRDKDRGGLGLPSSAAVLQLEDDAVFGPAAFADSTLQILRAAAADPSWQLLKLGECQTETDDRRVLVKPAQGCDAGGGVAASSGGGGGITSSGSGSSPFRPDSKYERLQRLDSFASLDYYDPRRLNNFCAHGYVVRGRMATELTSAAGGWLPPRMISDDLLMLACNGVDGRTYNNSLEIDQRLSRRGRFFWGLITASMRSLATGVFRYHPAAEAEQRRSECLRIEKHVYQQNHSIASTIPTSIDYNDAPHVNRHPATPYLHTLHRVGAALGLPDGVAASAAVSRRLSNANSSAAVWQAAHAACAALSGMELCKSHHFCPHGNISDFGAILAAAHFQHNFSRTAPHFAAQADEGGDHLWLPVAGHTWLRLGLPPHLVRGGEPCHQQMDAPRCMDRAINGGGVPALLVGCCQHFRMEGSNHARISTSTRKQVPPFGERTDGLVQEMDD